MGHHGQGTRARGSPGPNQEVARPQAERLRKPNGSRRGPPDEAMTAPAITIESWRTASDAAGLMLDRRVHRVPVLEDGKLVGIVTRADLVSAFARPDEEIALDIRDDVLLRTFWITPGDVDFTVRNGEVTLRGTVESDLLTQLLPEAVQRVPGVVRVKSRLVAQPTDTTPADVGLFRRI